MDLPMDLAGERPVPLRGDAVWRADELPGRPEWNRDLEPDEQRELLSLRARLRVEDDVATVGGRPLEETTVADLPIDFGTDEEQKCEPRRFSLTWFQNGRRIVFPDTTPLHHGLHLDAESSNWQNHRTPTHGFDIRNSGRLNWNDTGDCSYYPLDVRFDSTKLQGAVT